jgi:tetratricopeptide (TPR) repeat protein
MNRSKRRAAGQKTLGTRSSAGAASPAALYRAGLDHMQAGRYLDAQLCCEQALAAEADHADTLHLMGLLSFQAGQYDLAVAWMVRAIRQNPKPDYLSNLGTTLQRLGRQEEALKAFDKATQLKPADAGLWMKLGAVLVELKRLPDALLSFQHVLKLEPRHWDAAYASGSILQASDRFEEAINQFDLCRELRPDHALTLQRRGVSLRGLQRFEEFLADSRAAHALEPINAETCNNIGDALQLLGRNEEALEWFDKALAIRPAFAQSLNNKPVSLGQLHRFDEVFALYENMKALKLNDMVTDWNVSLFYLLTGNFEAGWAGHQARLKLPPVTYPEFPQPMWLGEENIEGKTVLICADEGLGDTIQFVRYVPMLAERGARIILAVQTPLHHLLSGLRGVAQCVPKSATGTLTGFDMHCPISSLPLAFATRLDTIPSATSYLPAPAANRVQVWEERFGPHRKLRVGLAWSGNPTHNNDHNRSLPLRVLSPILDLDATFVSLQKDPRPADRTTLHERNDIVDFTGHLSDFVETAALVSCLDLVITVDTSIAHLAGALGQPTWIVLPYTPDYRWLLDREDSPWYPTARLFRQTESREYASVVDRVRDALQARIAAFTPEISSHAGRDPPVTI